MFSLIWNPADNSDEQNMLWGRLRSLEWSSWPLFISQALAPVLLTFVRWQQVVIWVVLANVLWSMIRHRFVSITLASFGPPVVALKWVICPTAAVYLFATHQTISAVLALFWPLLVLLVPSVPGVRLGAIESLFMKKLGYSPSEHQAGSGAPDNSVQGTLEKYVTCPTCKRRIESAPGQVDHKCPNCGTAFRY